MDTSTPHPKRSPTRPPSSSRLTWWVFGGFAVIAAVMLAIEHRAHLLGWLPWVLLLACPLLHGLVHKGHGHGGHSSKNSGDKK